MLYQGLLKLSQRVKDEREIPDLHGWPHFNVMLLVCSQILVSQIPCMGHDFVSMDRVDADGGGLAL